MFRVCALFLSLLVLAIVLPGQARAKVAQPGLQAACHAASAADVTMARALAGELRWDCTEGGALDDGAVSWIAFRIADNDREGAHSLLTIRHGQFDNAEVYAISPDDRILYAAPYSIDTFEPALFGPYASVRLPDLPVGTRHIVVRFAGADLPSIGAEARLVSDADRSGFAAEGSLFLVALFGAALVPFVFVAGLYVILRHRFMLAHIGMTAGMLLALGAINGIAVSAFAPGVATLVSLTELGYALIGGSAGLFAASFLERDALSAIMRRALMAASCLVFVLAGSMALHLPGTQLLDQSLYVYAFVPLMIVVLTAMAQAAARRSRMVWFIVIGWLPAIASGMDMVASGLGWQNGRTLGVSAPYMAMGFEILVTGIGVVTRIMNLRRERDDAIRDRKVMEELTRRDALTGLFNRRALSEQFEARVAEGFTTLALIDLDDFKAINDEMGHAVGDEVLKAVAQALAPDTNVAAIRMGGEEFLLMLRGPNALERAERRRQAISRQVMHQVAGLGRPVTASMGVIQFESTGTSPDLGPLYARVDGLLYQAKNAGKNTFMVEIEPVEALKPMSNVDVAAA